MDEEQPVNEADFALEAMAAQLAAAHKQLAVVSAKLASAYQMLRDEKKQSPDESGE